MSWPTISFVTKVIHAPSHSTTGWELLRLYNDLQRFSYLPIPLMRPLIDFTLGLDDTLMNLYNIRFTSCV